MKGYISIIISAVFVLSACSVSKDGDTVKENTRGDFRVMFYNTENFFDVKHDTLKNDYEFLPDGKKYWDYYKFNRKVNNLAKVITAVGEWEQPAIVGLCEVENYYVLEQLANYSPLKNTGYKIIHKESPDRRGIDVALFYRKEKFQPIKYEMYKIVMPSNRRVKTRDILYVKGLVLGKDTLHVFVNHWPSRWGGQLKSEPKRMFVAKTLKHITDSLLKINEQANILIMGDFNDEPDNKSMKNILNAQVEITLPAIDTSLYNLTGYLQKHYGVATQKYRGTWGVLDQMIVSGALLNKKNKIYTSVENSHVFKADFLLEPDEKYTGERLNRTYIGYKYHDGFSDHLPVYTDIFITQ